MHRSRIALIVLTACLPVLAVAAERPAARLPVIAGIRWGGGPDLTRPVDLPVSAKPSPYRGAAGDPTAEFSKQAALAGKVPLRTTPTPFEPVNLPNPFELRDAVKLSAPLKEETAPPNMPVPPRP